MFSVLRDWWVFCGKSEDGLLFLLRQWWLLFRFFFHLKLALSGKHPIAELEMTFLSVTEAGEGVR